MITDRELADKRFQEWMRENLARAAKHFGLAITAAPVFGWRFRSISAPAVRRDGLYWVRVVSEQPQWLPAEFWTGNLDANAIADIAKPRVLDVYEWSEPGWRDQRAELMTRITGTPCSRDDVLRSALDVSDTWWAELHRSLDVLAATSTQRTHADQDRVVERIRSRFGNAVDPTVTQWATAHGDLHWSNLMCPRLAMLDWELWGSAPAGTDGATLLCYSLLVPDVAERVRGLFADLLGTPTGRVAQLYVIARLLDRIEGGDYPELAEPLAQQANALIGS